MKRKLHPFGNALEAVIYPLLLVVLMWTIYWADHLFTTTHFYQYGVRPGDFTALRGVLLMPLIHAKVGFEHIVNNSLPTAILLGAIIYYYRSIALRVFVISWLFSGLGVWLFAAQNGAYHIGMSGVIYAMAGFLFTSGVLRKFLPLQAISLFVAFVYGSMIWGIFPMEQRVSWEGHLSGLIVGVLLAVLYRKKGPQAPKFQYEIEKELGIDPPDLEGIWRAKVEEQKRREEERERVRLEKEKELRQQRESTDPLKVIYHYKPPTQKPSDDTDPQ